MCVWRWAQDSGVSRDPCPHSPFAENHCEAAVPQAPAGTLPEWRAGWGWGAPGAWPGCPQGRVPVAHLQQGGAQAEAPPLSLMLRSAPGFPNVQGSAPDPVGKENAGCPASQGLSG